MKISSGLRWAAAVAVMCLAAVAGAQQTVVSATALGTSSNPLVNGTIYWQPIGAAKGGAGGQVLGSARSATVTSGAFSITLPDALASSPNTCYRATAIDNATGNVALGAGFATNGIDINPGGSYGCIQPTGSTWSFDTYVPPATPPVIYVPVPGPAGAPGTGSIVGLTGDGTGNVNVSKSLTAASVVTGSTVITPVAYPQLGSLLNQTTWSGLTGYSSRGTTPSVSGSALAFTSGALGFAQSFDWVGSNSYATANPTWTQVIDEVAGTTSGTSYGLGVGIRSLGSITGQGDISAMCYVDLSSGSQTGKVIVYDNQAGTTYQLAVSSSAISFSAGNTIELTCTRNYSTITASARNLTTVGTPVSASFTYSLVYTGTTINLPNTGHYAIYNLGGSPTLSAYSIQSQMPVGAPIVQIGDSKTAGYWQGSFATSVAGLISAAMPATTLAGAGDRIASVSARLPEIAQTGAKYAILEIGYNDLGGTLSTNETNYQALVNSLVADGMTVFHLVEYSSATDQSAWLSWLQSTYGANVIYPNLSTYPSAYVLADGIHATPAGAVIIANSVLAALSTSLGSAFTQVPAAAVSSFVPYSGLDGSGNYQVSSGMTLTGPLSAPTLVATGTGSAAANQTFLGFASGAALIDSMGPNSSTAGTFQFNQYSSTGLVRQALGIDTSGNSTFAAALTVNGALYAKGTGSVAASQLFIGYSGSQAILASMGANSSTQGTFTFDSYTSVGGLAHLLTIDGTGIGTFLAGAVATYHVATGTPSVTASKSFLGFSSGKAIVGAIGANSSTSGTFQFSQYTSSGTEIKFLQSDTTGNATFAAALTITTGGSATKITCWKADGKTLGFATMAAGDISACN